MNLCNDKWNPFHKFSKSSQGGTPCELTSKKSFDNPGFGAATLLPVQVRNVINFTAD